MQFSLGWWCAAGVAAIWVLAYFRTPLVGWTLAASLPLLFFTFISPAEPLTLALWWAGFLVIVVPLNIAPLRRVLLSNRILPFFQAAIPTMSSTEREALEAGGVWWESELFSGRPRWTALLESRTPTLSVEEKAFLEGPVQRLCDMLDDFHITDELHDLPPEVWQFIKDKGFFGMIIPREYGGLGFSAMAHSAVVMKLAGRSITAAVTVMVPNSLGPAELLLRYGTEDQKNHYLPCLAKGKEVPCFALTGPEAGSDAGSIPDRGVVCRQQYKGKEIVGVRLNWDKRYITLGPVATVLGLAFKLYDPDRLLGGDTELGITLALIPTNTPGVKIGTRHYPLNMAFQNGPNWGQDVFIPLDWIIGGAERVGQGWRMLMECLAAGRSISLPSLATGAGKLVCRATGAYARIRKQFKLPIGRFEGVEEALARMAANTYMMDAARMLTVGALDGGHEPAVASAIVKYNLTERMRAVVNDAMDIQGGSAICMGPRNLLARPYQSIPISITVEGANILTRTLIIFGQGAIRCHPYILREMQAATDSNVDRGRREFDLALFGHIGFLISNFARTAWLSLTAARWASVPANDESRYYYRQVARLSAGFAFASDVAMLTLGGSLKRREKLSGRFADVLSQLYLISAALKRFRDDGRLHEDLPLLHWSCQDALFRAQEALMGILQNFPLRPVAWMLRPLLFPWGRPYKRPTDQMGREVAEILLSPSSARDRLTLGIYLTQDTSQAIGRVDRALDDVVAAEGVEKRIAHALKAGTLARSGGDDAALLRDAVKHGIVTQEDAESARRAALSRRDVIAVDDFPADTWTK